MRIRLRRRGLDHGTYVVRSRATTLAAGEPVVIRRFVRPPSCTAEWRLLQRLRDGEDLAALVAPPRGFRFTGISQTTQDPLELHKLHVEPGDLYVKVNWLSTHRGDGSLRLRFSYGAEVLDDFVHDPARVRRTLKLAEAIFPAIRAATKRTAQLGLIQPIVYSNQPDGGALFHHDFVPGQTGVVFTQLAGSTAWLTLPKFVLARHLEAHTGRKRLSAAMERNPDDLSRVLNFDRRFTKRLADDGWLFVLRPGDAIVLPSNSLETTAWHSVFAASTGRNLALSCGFRKSASSLAHP